MPSLRHRIDGSPRNMDGLEVRTRCVDVLGAGVVAAVTLPLQVLVALAVRLEDGGPVLFRQERVGRNGQAFHIRKFRTMTEGHAGPTVSVTGDGRVTRVGRLLRRTKIDELPQVYDVLQGRMSLVGPRPEVPKYVALWPSGSREVILSVRPGITDPASIEFRKEGDVLAAADDPERHYVDVLLPRKVELYMTYVRTRSTRGDFRILARTIRAIFS